MNANLPFTAFDETNLAIDAIKKASKSIMEIYNTNFSTSTKNNNEPITEADTLSNKIILDSLAKSGYPVLSEESPDDIQKRLDSNKVWIVDPLDGTTDFVNKTGEFTVMIALVEERIPILGVISCPSQNALYLAQKGAGAYFTINNDSWQKLEVSKTPEIQNCKVVGSRFHQSEKERQFMKSLGISKFTSKGSSLKALDVSSGNADLYFTFTSKMKHWDTCASYCIVSEAGGKITDMLGNDIVYNTQEVHHKHGLLVTNGIIHSDITKRFEKFQNP